MTRLNACPQNCFQLYGPISLLSFHCLVIQRVLVDFHKPMYYHTPSKTSHYNACLNITLVTNIFSRRTQNIIER